MPERRRGRAPHAIQTPRGLSERERQGLLRAADILIPGGMLGPPPSRQEGFLRQLDRALAARHEAFELIMCLSGWLSEVPAAELEAKLRRLSTDAGSGFDDLSTVIAGAYLMNADVRRSLGYPGQSQRAPRFDEAAEEIMSGIIEPVIARGRVYRSVAGPAGG